MEKRPKDFKGDHSTVIPVCPGGKTNPEWKETKGSKRGKAPPPIPSGESEGILDYNLVKGESPCPLGQVIRLPKEPAAFFRREKHTRSLISAGMQNPVYLKELQHLKSNISHGCGESSR